MKDWKDFGTNQDSLESINVLRKILEKWKKNNLGVLVKQDGTITNPGVDNLEYLMKDHFLSMTPPAQVNHNHD